MAQPPQLAALLRRYADGPDVLEAALATVPADALRWRPGPGRWSAHEVVVHCADSETNAHMRVRYLLAEPAPRIVGYDQDRWADVMDYHSHPLGPALAAIRAVRANTLPLLERLPPDAWSRSGHHTETGTVTVATWLETYAVHLEVHGRQIERNVAAWAAHTGTEAAR